MNSALLDAAREVDALTYDLAAEVIPRSNGPEGGTPEGSRLSSLTWCVRCFIVFWSFI
jgi:hypothetical protein